MEVVEQYGCIIIGFTIIAQFQISVVVMEADMVVMVDRRLIMLDQVILQIKMQKMVQIQ